MPQASAERGRIALTSLGLFISALFLTAYSAKNPWLASTGSVVISEALRPLQTALQGVTNRSVQLWDHYVYLVGLREEYEHIQDRVKALEAENSRLLEWEAEIKRLRALLNVAQERNLQGVAADVIGYDPSNWVRAVTVDRGSHDGIERGMAAIQGDALVGQVISVSPTTSRILLITDHSSGADVIVQSSRTRGVVEGEAEELCELRYVANDEEVAVGDRIISSGMDGIFPKGLLVGVVSQVERHEGMFQNILVKPAVDFSRLETLLIVTKVPAEIAPAVRPDGGAAR